MVRLRGMIFRNTVCGNDILGGIIGGNRVFKGTVRGTSILREHYG